MTCAIRIHVQVMNFQPYLRKNGEFTYCTLKKTKSKQINFLKIKGCNQQEENMQVKEKGKMIKHVEPYNVHGIKT